MLGCAMAASRRWNGDISRLRTSASAVRSTSGSSRPASRLRPSISASSAVRLGETRSIRPFSSASSAVNERLSTTAASASSALRPLRAASERIWAAASCSTFSPSAPSISSPCPPTGWAAPVLVPGAMAATSAAIRMKNPAEAAWAPLGDT